jgi:hypothetical protein
VKTTIELPEDLLRRAKTAASLRGQSLRDLFTDAVRDHLARTAGIEPGQEGWRRVFGQADPAEVAEVDRVVTEDLETIDLGTWR